MILYSIIPTEAIYQGFDQFNPQFEDVVLDGCSMQIERINENQGRIVRLYSVNPQDYLKPHFSPGSIITYSPTIISS
jgi:hypothetical protein